MEASAAQAVAALEKCDSPFPLPQRALRQFGHVSAHSVFDLVRIVANPKPLPAPDSATTAELEVHLGVNQMTHQLPSRNEG